MAGARELITRAYFDGIDQGQRGDPPAYQLPPGLTPTREALLRLLHARGYRLGRLAGGHPMPAATIRDELTETTQPPPERPTA